ncbi:Envelope glycoprotein gp160 [Gnomoniopsis sp. IMI 355080]|nr:Envelope glycoprotein gp160 [Gnomoniopsis sp. IMI 355080]
MTSNHTQAYLDELDAMKQASCYPYRSDIDPSYGYVPSFAAGVLFSILFAIPFFYHTFQSVRLRATTSILLALGALTELIGWAARAYSGKCPYNGNAFMSQEVTLIIAPVFFSAALYVLLGKLILDLGPRSSIISAKWYAIIFCSCDVGSLIVQAIGGAKASMADTNSDMELGTHIMVAGIAFQLFTMTLFVGLMVDFLVRVLRTQGEFRGMVTKGMQYVFMALVISTVMIYIRSVYRTIELAQGWHGYLISHEGYFIGLDAAIMVVAVGVFVPVDPAVVFAGEGRPGYARKMRGAKGLSSGEPSDAELAMETVRY